MNPEKEEITGDTANSRRNSNYPNGRSPRGRAADDHQAAATISATRVAVSDRTSVGEYSVTRHLMIKHAAPAAHDSFRPA